MLVQRFASLLHLQLCSFSALRQAAVNLRQPAEPQRVTAGFRVRVCYRPQCTRGLNDMSIKTICSRKSHTNP